MVCQQARSQLANRELAMEMSEQTYTIINSKKFRVMLSQKENRWFPQATVPKIKTYNYPQEELPTTESTIYLQFRCLYEWRYPKK